MKSRILNITLAILLIAAGYVWGNRSVVHAESHTSSMPRSWGHIVAGSADTGQIIMEDNMGVIRFVTAYSGSVTMQVNRAP